MRRSRFACTFVSGVVAAFQSSCLLAHERAPSPPAATAPQATTDLSAVDLETLRADCAKDRAIACLAFAERVYFTDLELRTKERHEAALKACALGQPDACGIAGVTLMFTAGEEKRAHRELWLR